MVNKYRKDIDWESMRPDWVAGVKPVLQLSREHDVSRAAIIKHWEAEGVGRDLAKKIRAKANSLVTQSLVTLQVTPKRTVTDAEIIEANAIDSATIQISERKDVARFRSVSMTLLNELESQVVDKELYQRLGELMDSPDEVLRLLAKEYMAATGRKITPAGIKKHYYVLGIPRVCVSNK